MNDLLLMNLLGIVLSLLFVFAVIGVSTLFMKKGILKEEGSRKLVHIAVGNWWIIAMVFFSSLWFAISVPALFVVLNFISYKTRLFEGMEREDSAGGLGTVYYALSLLILSVLSFRPGGNPWTGAAGILVMSYGDGFAAVLGSRWGRRRFRIFGGNKSLEGFAGMAVFSFAVLLILYAMMSGLPAGHLVLPAMILALAAGVIELLSPLGLDNLTVPLLVALLFHYSLPYLPEAVL